MKPYYQDKYKLWQEGDVITVDIVYKRKDGSRIYPSPFKISRNKVLSCPSQWNQGVKLYIVPIDMMQEVIRQ